MLVRSRLSRTVTAVAATLLVSGVASAHVTITSGPAAANTSQVVTFGVAHGCSGADTLSVTVDIPASVTSVRPLPSVLGRPTLKKDNGGTITSVTWRKNVADVLAADEDYYTFQIRFKTPNTPFTTLYFTAHQTCRDAMGNQSVVDWVGLPTTPVPDGGTAPEPAPALLIVPARSPGWNKYTVPDAQADLSVYFGDAQVVWSGNAAYSANPNTAAQIAATQGVTALKALAKGDTVWVKY